MFIDTHCHITHDDYQDIPMLINDIKEAGISKIIVNGDNIKSNIEVLELMNKYDIVYGAIGFQPTELNDFSLKYFQWLEEHIRDDKIVAVGEIGLDYHYDDTDKEKQEMVFRKQLEIAEKYHIPVIVHSRDSIQDTYNILKEYNVSGSIHCFSGSKEMAREFIKIGFMIGIGGVCTYKNAKNIIDVIENIPLEYILLETDAPYLTPEPYRGNKNSSKYLPIIANKIAEIKNVSLSKVVEITGKNASRMFFNE